MACNSLLLDREVDCAAADAAVGGDIGVGGVRVGVEEVLQEGGVGVAGGEALRTDVMEARYPDTQLASHPPVY